MTSVQAANEKCKWDADPDASMIKLNSKHAAALASETNGNDRAIAYTNQAVAVRVQGWAHGYELCATPNLQLAAMPKSKIHFYKYAQEQERNLCVRASYS